MNSDKIILGLIYIFSLIVVVLIVVYIGMLYKDLTCTTDCSTAIDSFSCINKEALR